MRVTKYSFLFIAMLFFSISVFASTQSIAAEKLSELLNGFTTFQANFTQVTQDGQLEVLQKSSGNMMLMRPGYFRWETQHPDHQIVITNGNTLWIYDVDLQQATKQSIKNTPMNPAKLLSGKVDLLLKQFSVTMIPHSKILVFQLTPKNPKQQFRSIAIAFKHDKLYRIQIRTNLEQTSTFTFSHIKMNKKLSPALFEFKAPSSVDVLH